jgi:hypothetical protein
VASNAATEQGGFMKCEEAAEFVSSLCDGEMIPREVAEHIGTCAFCHARLDAYSAMGAELRRIASLEQPATMKAGPWETEQRVRLWWRKGSATMRIPRFAFASMLALILLLSSGLVLVRARTGGRGSVLVLTFKLLPDGATGDCIITTDGNAKTDECGYTPGVRGGMLGLKFRFVSREGDRTQLGVQATYKSHADSFHIIDDFKDVPERTVWVEPGEQEQITVSGLGEVELTGEYLDHMPSLRFRPKETLDPQENEFRVVAPVLIRGKELLFNLAGSNSIDSGDRDATVMIYYPGEGRYLISTAPFEGAIEGSVEPGQIKFNLDGQDYLLLTAMPTTRSEHVWVSHDPQYKVSEHMQGASDDRPMFMVRSLNKLLQQRIQHIM